MPAFQTSPKDKRRTRPKSPLPTPASGQTVQDGRGVENGSPGLLGLLLEVPLDQAEERVWINDIERHVGMSLTKTV